MTRFIVDSRRPDVLTLRLDSDMGVLDVHIELEALRCAYGGVDGFVAMVDTTRDNLDEVRRVALRKARLTQSRHVLLRGTDLASRQVALHRAGEG